MLMGGMLLSLSESLVIATLNSKGGGERTKPYGVTLSGTSLSSDLPPPIPIVAILVLIQNITDVGIPSFSAVHEF